MTKPTKQPLVEVTIGEDGARYTLDHIERLVHLWVYDPTGDDALLVMEPAHAARLRDDLSRTLIAGGRSEAQLKADVLIGSLRHTMGLVEEFKKISSAEVARIYATLLSHIRNACPEAFRAMQEAL